MKETNYRVIAYERTGPLSDMFVPHKVTIAPVRHISRRVPTFAIVALLLAAIPAFALPSGTLSYFSDDERSTGNTFAAGPLDFTVSPNHATSTLFLNQAGDTYIITPVPVAGSLPMRYRVSGAASGNVAFCAAISASGGAPLPYVGSTTSFTTSDTDSFTPWSLTLLLPSPAPGVVDGQICILDLTYDAYQAGGAPGTEYHSTKHVVLTLTADPPVITSAPATVLDLTPPSEPIVTEEATTTTEEASSTDPALSQAELPPVGEATSSPVLDESVTPEQITITYVLPEPQPDVSEQ